MVEVDATNFFENSKRQRFGGFALYVGGENNIIRYMKHLDIYVRLKRKGKKSVAVAVAIFWNG